MAYYSKETDISHKKCISIVLGVFFMQSGEYKKHFIKFNAFFKSGHREISYIFYLFMFYCFMYCVYSIISYLLHKNLS